MEDGYYILEGRLVLVDSDEIFNMAQGTYVGPIEDFPLLTKLRDLEGE